MTRAFVPSRSPYSHKEMTLGIALRRLRGWLGRTQARVLADMKHSEEEEWFAERLTMIADTIQDMPVVYGTKGESVAHLHYFTAGADWWIAEKDITPDPAQEDWQWQAYGLADLYQDGGEIGYICIPELLAAGAELDLHWQPRTLEECRRK